MKHFIIEITFLLPAEQIAETVAEHRAFLQTGYDRGLLLLSGPLVPRTGGMVVARAPSMEDLQQFFQDDPYQKKGLARYRFIEYNPVMWQNLMRAWIDGQ